MRFNLTSAGRTLETRLQLRPNDNALYDMTPPIGLRERLAPNMSDDDLRAAYQAGKAAFIARRAPLAVQIQARLADLRAAELADSTIAAAKAALDAAWANIPRGPGIPPVANAEVTAAEAAYQVAWLANSTVQAFASEIRGLFSQRRPGVEEADALDVVREMKLRGIPR